MAQIQVAAVKHINLRQQYQQATQLLLPFRGRLALSFAVVMALSTLVYVLCWPPLEVAAGFDHALVPIESWRFYLQSTLVEMVAEGLTLFWAVQTFSMAGCLVREQPLPRFLAYFLHDAGRSLRLVLLLLLCHQAVHIAVHSMLYGGFQAFVDVTLTQASLTRPGIEPPGERILLEHTLFFLTGLFLHLGILLCYYSTAGWFLLPLYAGHQRDLATSLRLSARAFTHNVSTFVALHVKLLVVGLLLTLFIVVTGGLGFVWVFAVMVPRFHAMLLIMSQSFFPTTD